MSDYTYTEGFAAKDALPSGDADKVIKGTELEAEFDAIETAVNSKADKAGPTFTGTTTVANLTASGTINSTGTLQISGVAITSTAAELNILDGVTATAAELNILDGVTSTAAELNILDGVTSTTAELNILDGVTATTAELNYVGGVTSNIQTQLAAKAASSHTHATSDVTSGTFADARISESSVTQHESAIDAGSVDGYDVVVDSGSPSGTDANTIYFVT